jgi:outer membrane protein TolC
LGDAQRLYKAGVVAEYDVLRAQKEVASQDKRLTDAKNQHDLATLSLLNDMDMPLNSSSELASGLENKSYSGSADDAAKLAGSSSSLVEALRLQAAADDKLSKAQAAQSKPTVAVSAFHNIIQEDLTSLEPNSFVMLTVNWPLYDGGAGHAKELQKRAESQKSLDEAQKAQNLLELGAHQAFDDLDSGNKGLIEANKALNLAKESERLASRRFETGVGTSLEKIDSILGVSEAEVQQDYALFQVESAYYKLLYYTNRLLPEFNAPSALLGKETTK